MSITHTNESKKIIRVLHIDDEPDQLKFAKFFLEKADAGLQVESASSPEEAQHLLQQQSFDCVVSDYVMPGMDGIEFARKVRKKSQVPFILYTGHGREEVAKAAIAAGVDDCIQKEFDLGQYHVLAKRVRVAVEKRHFKDKIGLSRDLNEDQGKASRIRTHKR